MADSENVANQKSSDYDDGAYDADLEARLYAQIYYSNETFVPTAESSVTKDTQTPVTAIPSPSVKTSLANESSVCEENHLTSQKSFRLDEISPAGQSRCSTNVWISDTSNQRTGKREFVRKQRLLTREGLWSTACNTEPKERPVEQTSEKPTELPDVPIIDGPLSTNSEIYVIPDDSTSAREVSSPTKIFAAHRKKREKREKLRQYLKAQIREKKKSANQNYTCDDAGVTTETSKYRVVSKKKKLKMIQMNSEPVNISSDSDDSILEVPVPPKAPPVIIQLPDSDDDCERSTDDIEKNDDSVTCESNAPNDLADREVGTLRKSAIIAGDDRSNARNPPEAFVEPLCPDSSGLILNCTEIQRGASSLDEIRKIRETMVTSIHAHSDDSMTESEANNWVNIAAGQSDVARDEEIGLNDTVNTELWNQLSQENIAEGSPSVQIASSSSALTDPVDPPVERMEKVTKANEESVITRKRPTNLSSNSSMDFDGSAIPEKRSKPSKEQSLTEYFFKPMSKKLQAFYNNPWGGENMNLYDIQSRMPKNPRCWTILDADLQGPASKRRRACPRCKTDSHFGKRCPEKAKAPCCYMCGTKGHTESRCPHTMCLTCGRKYATYRPTCGYCSRLHCDMCKGLGHESENCPDLWRRYHNTTTETEKPVVPREALNIMKAPQLLTCCNCAKRGHDVTMCKQLRWSQHFPTPICVSSYTRGPFYESLNDPKAISRHDTIGERINYSNPNTDPVCVPPDSEEIDNDAPSEIIEIADDFPTPIDEPSSAGTTLFKSGNFDSSEQLKKHRISRRLDGMPNVHLDGLLTGRLMPIFLHAWQSFFRFRIEITRDSDNSVIMELEAKSLMQMRALEKLIMQWFSRNDEEKSHLEYDILPYDNVDMLRKQLKLKMIFLHAVFKPTVLLRKIIGIEVSIKRITGNSAKKLTPKKAEKKRWQINCQMNLLTKKRSQLVTSLYRHSWVKDANTTVGHFCKIARKNRAAPKDRLPSRDYLELIYLNNEIFTLHTNAELSEAINRVMTESELITATDDDVQQDPATPRWNLRSRAQVPPIETEPIDDSDVPGKDSTALSVYCSPLTTQITEQITVVEDRAGDGGESSRIPSVFGIADAPIANVEIPADFIGEWSAPFKPVVPNGIVPQKSTPATFVPQKSTPATFVPQKSTPATFVARNRRKLIGERAGRTKIAVNQGLLTQLTKRNRKLYKDAARGVIKLANSTNLPHLQEMAKSMKFKIGNGSVTTEDVHTLQTAIETETGRKYVPKAQSKKSRQSLQNNFDNTYQHFLTTL